MKLLLKFLHLPISEKALLFKTISISAAVRVSLMILPFRLLRAYLKNVSKTRSFADPTIRPSRENIIWALEVCERYFSWTKNCLSKAITAQILFRKAHYVSTLHIGVAKNDASAFGAHAWVECDGKIVTGFVDEGPAYQPLVRTDGVIV